MKNVIITRVDRVLIVDISSPLAKRVEHNRHKWAVNSKNKTHPTYPHINTINLPLLPIYFYIFTQWKFYGITVTTSTSSGPRLRWRYGSPPLQTSLRRRVSKQCSEVQKYRKKKSSNQTFNTLVNMRARSLK